MTLFCTRPLVPLLSSRMECLSKGCIWRGRVGIRKLPVWWRQSPCSWSVPCPPSTSNLWRAARGSPRVSTQSYTHPCVTKSSLLNSAVKFKSVLSVIVDVLMCVCRYVLLSLLLLPRTVWRYWSPVIRGGSWSEVWSCALWSLGQERNRSAHEPW